MEDKKKRLEGAGTKAYERNRAYLAEHYKRLNIVLTPDMLEQINQAAAGAGMSKNGWIIAAIEEKLKSN